MSDAPLAAVARLLMRHGIVADVSRAGHARDVVAITAGVDRFETIRELSAEIRAFGFRYVTLEITTSEES